MSFVFDDIDVHSMALGAEVCQFWFEVSLSQKFDEFEKKTISFQIYEC